MNLSCALNFLEKRNNWWQLLILFHLFKKLHHPRVLEIFWVLNNCRTPLHLHAWPDQSRKNLLDHLHRVDDHPGRVLVHLPLHLLAKHSSHNIGGVNRYETEIVVKQIFKFNPIGPYAFHSRFQIHNELVTWQCLIICCCNFCYLSYLGGSTIWVFDWGGSLG